MEVAYHVLQILQGLEESWVNYSCLNLKAVAGLLLRLGWSFRVIQYH
jgi:hypothetical protein